jgi:hypothetical protein
MNHRIKWLRDARARAPSVVSRVHPSTVLVALSCACSGGTGDGSVGSTSAESLIAGTLPGTATASSVQGTPWPASNAVDGNLTTRWSSAFSDPQWIQVDLGAVHELDHVTIVWQHAFSLVYDVQVSNDGTTWTTAFHNPAGTGGTETVPLKQSARFIRLYSYKRATQYGVSIYEIEIFPSTTRSQDASAPDGLAGEASAGDTSTDTSPDTSGPDAPPPDAPAPDSGSIPFWDTSNIPPAKNVMTFKFLNRTNGVFSDSQVFWSFKSGTINEIHSIAEQSTYDMPANASGRMYFYVCGAGSPSTCVTDPTTSPYYDFIEHTISATVYNGNTTRVDAFGLKIAMRLHCADGYDVAVGDSLDLFNESRAATFQQFLNEVPVEFQHLAQSPFAPYRIVNPGAGQFKVGGLYADYYDSVVNEIWAANSLTVPRPGPNGSGLSAYPNLSAAIFRHTGTAAGSFTTTGALMNTGLWSNPATFYTAPPANYYAKFWHTHGLNGKAYGFPYDDVGGYSSYVSHANPQYLLVAVGY